MQIFAITFQVDGIKLRSVCLLDHSLITHNEFDFIGRVQSSCQCDV